MRTHLGGPARSEFMIDKCAPGVLPAQGTWVFSSRGEDREGGRGALWKAPPLEGSPQRMYRCSNAAQLPCVGPPAILRQVVVWEGL